MLNLLLEGFSSAWLPCSLILLVPGAAALLAARHQVIPAVAGFASSAMLLAWFRFSDRGGDWPLAVAALALAVATVMFLVPLVAAEEITATIAGILAGGAASELWEPCVGPEFGQLLNSLPDNGVAGLGQLAVFMLGVLAPLAGFIALLKLTPDWIMEAAGTALSVIGGTVLAVIAVATAVGLHDDVVGKLFQWSLS